MSTFRMNTSLFGRLGLTIFVLLSSAYALAGGVAGGGQGGFCINTICVTLAEAGFRIQQPYVNAPVVPPAAFVATKRILSKLNIPEGIKTDIKESAFANDGGQFLRVKSYNPKKFEEYRDDYLNLLKKYDFKATGFKLFAVSNPSTETTYLLPEFYHLTPFQQGLVLIHEGIVRYTGSVMLALKLDGAILDTLKGKPARLQILEVILRENHILTSTMPIGSYDWAMKKYFADSFLLDNLPGNLPIKVKKLLGRYNYQTSAENDSLLYQASPMAYEDVKQFGITSIDPWLLQDYAEELSVSCGDSVVESAAKYGLSVNGVNCSEDKQNVGILKSVTNRPDITSACQFTNTNGNYALRLRKPLRGHLTVILDCENKKMTQAGFLRIRFDYPDLKHSSRRKPQGLQTIY